MMGTAQNAGTVVTLKDGRTRRFRSKQERRHIVEETLKPGASVALIARAHDVNTNQVFKWRRQYNQGRLEIESATALVPVQISDRIVPRSKPQPRIKPKTSGTIDIELGHARVRIAGAVDPECVRAALAGLVR
jgi:transposase